MQKKLSSRENEVYELLISGKTNREICRELCICRGTLERHITSIYRKKGVKNRFELVFKSKKYKRKEDNEVFIIEFVCSYDFDAHKS